MMPNGSGDFCWSVSGVTGIDGVLGDTFMDQFYIVCTAAAVAPFLTWRAWLVTPIVCSHANASPHTGA